MVRLSFLLFLCALVGYGNETPKQDDIIVIDNTSDVSSNESRKQADTLHSLETKQKLQKVLPKGSSKKLIKKIAASWEELSPTPNDGYDWIKLKHGDWLKGHIRSFYDDEVEFETKEFGIHHFKITKIAQIKSFDAMQVNIDNTAIFKGIIRYNAPTITIISGKNSYKFDKSMIIAITTAKEQERYKWAGDIALNIDVRRGNSDQADYSLKLFLQRRTTKNRFSFDYLGRYSEAKDIATAKDSRYNVRYDYFITKKFFITPIFGEFYENHFQNIDAQMTLGSGFGYSIYNHPTLKWDISAGPAYLLTKYQQEVQNIGKRQDGVAFEITSKYEYKINKITKLIFDYKFTFMKKDLGSYKHHTITKLENDIIKDRIFIDISFIWDYLANPQATQEQNLQKSDYQTLVGGGVKF